LKDGWFATGDIGEITSQGQIRITDRKKDLIKTAGGKYVAPQKLEGLIKRNPYVSCVLIHGDKRKYIVALITLDPIKLEEYAKANQIEYDTYENLTQHASILEMVRKTVTEANNELASYESIKKFSLLKKDFTVADGELTPSMKVKRKFLDQKFKAQIEALYD
jgi:long-chain acyl-CoA synthetase